MIQSVGDIAGEVWKLLNGNGEATLSHLKKGMEVIRI